MQQGKCECKEVISKLNSPFINHLQTGSRGVKLWKRKTLPKWKMRPDQLVVLDKQAENHQKTKSGKRTLEEEPSYKNFVDNNK